MAGQAEPSLQRKATVLERAGTAMERAATNFSLQRAGTLPTDDKQIYHAATMPMTYDTSSARPFCGGLWKTQQLIGFILGIFFVFLFHFVEPIQEYPMANDMLGITTLVGCFWVFEVAPLPITALIPVVALPLAGITSAAIIGHSYWNWIQMLVVAMFFMDIALEEVFLPRRVALLALLKVGVVQPPVLMAMFMLISFVMSMFCNTIAVALIVAPFATSLMNAAEEQLRDDLASSSEGETSEEDEEEVVTEVQRMADGIMLSIAYASSIGGFSTLTGCMPNFILAGQALVSEKISWFKWFGFAMPVALVMLVVAYAVLYVRYIQGLKVRGLTREVLEREYEQLEMTIGVSRDQLLWGTFTRDEVAVGVLCTFQIAALIVRPFLITPYVTTRDGVYLVNDASIAMVPVILLCFVPSMVRQGQAILTPRKLHDKFDMGLVLLIGGGFAIAQGFTQSGLDLASGHAVSYMLQHFHPFLLNFIIITFVSASSQMFSSIGTATTILPMLAAAAKDVVQDPLIILLPATIACSFTFSLPTAAPQNVVILAKSQDLPRPLRVRDFFLTGLPINLISVVIATIMVPPLAAAFFDVNAPFSQASCSQLFNCVWMAVPGTVQGTYVESQACLLQDMLNDEACMIWNGTIIKMTG